ncbi:flagellar biosynthesis anti-sigma factor FlgM [Sphingomonas sp. BGYR3]|uniref:flagellar biosynthesis anti-sigma factor FlgM n=1 Tax=Sphingomonas sp. BGYR3 TaxID=2975483 RepID=UPI0021A6C312|nr:flagellar biosynthesis anti-sigma factor FlgM [Sphingomonas sp. BGYR3]MDG5488983.1 flagellar biosynthesis anti-sigma factor FlgM [Sphingomonas sp. BGYR3]
MVDPIGIKPIQTGDRAGPVTAVRPARTPEPTADNAARTAQPGVRTLARQAAEKPEVRAERVAEVKRAIERGDFPILPYTIADQLIALRLDWLDVR